MHPRHDNATTRHLADSQERAAGHIVRHVACPSDALPTRAVVTTVAPLLPNSTVIIAHDGNALVEYTVTKLAEPVAV